MVSQLMMWDLYHFFQNLLSALTNPKAVNDWNWAQPIETVGDFRTITWLNVCSTNSIALRCSHFIDCTKKWEPRACLFGHQVLSGI